jgi:hypothetical protein
MESIVYADCFAEDALLSMRFVHTSTLGLVTRNNLRAFSYPVRDLLSLSRLCESILECAVGHRELRFVPVARNIDIEDPVLLTVNKVALEMHLHTPDSRGVKMVRTARFA